MKRYLTLIYAALAYFGFLGLFLYWLGFLINFGVPKAIDGEARGSFIMAAVINISLVLIFSIQHSLMARPAFKKVWTQFIPKHLERSTYVLMSNLALAFLFFAWQPMGGVIWNVENFYVKTVLYVLFAAGALTVVATSFLINHFDLFGLRQAWFYFKGQEYKHLKFSTPGPYKVVRHPLYVGWLMTLWITPLMTIAHLVFALAFTLYILVAIGFEERDLENTFGSLYARYRKQTPMLLPSIKLPFLRHIAIKELGYRE